MALIASTSSGRILLVLLALCGPAGSLRIGSSGPFRNGEKPSSRHPLYGRIYDAYRKNLASGANLPKPVPVSGLLGYKRSRAQDKSADEFPLGLVKDARASAGGHTSGHDESMMRTTSTKSQPYVASQRGRHGYDDDGYGDEGHYYGDDDEGYDYGYGDKGYGYGDDGYGYGDDGYGYGDDGYGYGDDSYSYGDHRYDNTIYRYGESHGYGEKRERYGGGGRGGGHSGKYAARGGYNGGGYRSGEGYTDTAACKCKNLGIIGSLAGFSTIPALVALVSQLTQSEGRSARAFSSDILVSEKRASSSKETSETAVNGALKLLEEPHLLQRSNYPLTHSRAVRATRGLSVGHGNPHCQCTIGILGSIAGFASLTTLLGFALARADSNEGGDVGGDVTRTSIKISDMRNITSQAVSSPSLAEGSSLIESFPSLTNLGPLRGNLSYSDLHRTSHPPLLFSSPPGSPDTVPGNMADHSIRKDQVGEQGIRVFSSQSFSKKGLTEGYQ